MLEVKDYSRKPYGIQAVKFTGGSENAMEIKEWLKTLGYIANWSAPLDPNSEEPERILIEPADRTWAMEARVGFYIIHHESGDVYFCEDEQLFFDTYRPADFFIKSS